MAVPRLVVVAMIFNTERTHVLLTLNKRDPENTRYSFSGGVGYFKKYSNPDDVVVREVQNDMGCLFNGKFFTYSFEEREDGPVLTMYYVGTIKGDPHPVCKNIHDVKFVPIEEARTMNLQYQHNQMLEAYLDSVLLTK